MQPAPQVRATPRSGINFATSTRDLLPRKLFKALHLFSLSLFFSRWPVRYGGGHSFTFFSFSLSLPSLLPEAVYRLIRRLRAPNAQPQARPQASPLAREVSRFVLRGGGGGGQGGIESAAEGANSCVRIKTSESGGRHRRTERTPIPTPPPPPPTPRLAPISSFLAPLEGAPPNNHIIAKQTHKRKKNTKTKIFKKN